MKSNSSAALTSSDLDAGSSQSVGIGVPSDSSIVLVVNPELAHALTSESAVLLGWVLLIILVRELTRFVRVCKGDS